ncbi:MAG: type II toxin-antitoxin system Phd/YefM family antitoxin [Candidatus Sungbacteria bacterium]|nr:type II toxin-antitoxin system Phd/YefM family antitoxin [bacterium]MDZ4285509.1 type II toxin-antitoxin system Phd/YefM family antitoxin [Candidatus Sungbacteria bacterium]
MKQKTTLPISEARKKIFDIAQAVQKPDTHYILTEKGRPKAVILSAEEYDSLMETMEILSDPEVLEKIKTAEAEYARGVYVTWDELKEEIGYVPKTERASFVADKGVRRYTVGRKKRPSKTT